VQNVCRQYRGRLGTRAVGGARDASARYVERVKGSTTDVGLCGKMGERGEMGVASVRVKVGNGTRSGSVISSLSAFDSAVGGGEDESGMIKRKVGHGSVLVLRRSSWVVMGSPEDENRLEKTTPESPSTKESL
jgi:hypothetical protein